MLTRPSPNGLHQHCTGRSQDIGPEPAGMYASSQRRAGAPCFQVLAQPASCTGSAHGSPLHKHRKRWQQCQAVDVLLDLHNSPLSFMWAARHCWLVVYTSFHHLCAHVCYLSALAASNTVENTPSPASHTSLRLPGSAAQLLQVLTSSTSTALLQPKFHQRCGTFL